MPKVLLLFFLLFLPINQANAQTPTGQFTIKLGSFTPAPTIPRPTQLPVTSVPNDPGTDPGTDPGNNGSVSLIYDLYNQIKRTCGGGIYNLTNIGCVSNLKLPQPVKDELWGSASSQGWLQCIGFVRAAGALVGTPWPRVWGHAISYATYNVPPGYKFVAKTGRVNIRSGDIPIWNSWVVGHIAYVTKINNSNDFEVAEANSGCSGCVKLTIKTLDHPNLIGWLRKI